MQIHDTKQKGVLVPQASTRARACPLPPPRFVHVQHVPRARARVAASRDRGKATSLESGLIASNIIVIIIIITILIIAIISLLLLLLLIIILLLLLLLKHCSARQAFLEGRVNDEVASPRNPHRGDASNSNNSNNNDNSSNHNSSHNSHNSNSNKDEAMPATRVAARRGTHGSLLIRRQHGHLGVVLPLVISNSANHEEGTQLELSPIRNEPK